MLAFHYVTILIHAYFVEAVEYLQEGTKFDVLIMIRA